MMDESSDNQNYLNKVSRFTENYISYYKPLIQEFLRDIEFLDHPKIERMPEPHFPLFGTNYERSALRLVIVGQDTKGWGDLREYIDAETAVPGSKLRKGLKDFSDHNFLRFGPLMRQRFFGFVLKMLGALHGEDQWRLMNRGRLNAILDSFAWAEGNPIEFYNSTVRSLGVPRVYWDAVRRAGERFNEFRHLLLTLKPHVAIILSRGLNASTYFEGYRYEVVSQDGRLTHYRLPEVDVDVIRVPHPRNMNFKEGIDHFVTKIRELFIRTKITVPYPQFLTNQKECREVMEYLQNKAPTICSDFDKYALVDWVAEELAKKKAYMSVPTLMDLVNSKGGKTNYGTQFSKKRGSYNLVSGTYRRLIADNKEDNAQRVAEAFLKPNFEYAYCVG